MVKSKLSALLPSILGGFLLIEWLCVYLVGGRLGVLSWWSIMCGSIIGAMIAVVMGMRFLIKLFGNKRINLYEVIMLILGLVMAYPPAWLINI